MTEVSSAGPLGRDGRIDDRFRAASHPSTARFVELRVDQRATEKNKSLELAAGASMAGVMLLGPLGLVGGYFVKGKDVGIQERQPFYVETLRTVQLSGFILRSSRKIDGSR